MRARAVAPAEVVADITKLIGLFKRVDKRRVEELRKRIEKLRRHYNDATSRTVMLFVAEYLVESALAEVERSLGVLQDSLAESLVRLKARLARMPDKLLRREVRENVNKVLGELLASLREELGYIRDEIERTTVTSADEERGDAERQSSIQMLIEEVLRRPRVSERLGRRLNAIERCRSSLELLEEALSEAAEREEELWRTASRRLILGGAVFATIMGLARLDMLETLSRPWDAAAWIALLAAALVSWGVVATGFSRLLDYIALKGWFDSLGALLDRVGAPASLRRCEKLFEEAVEHWRRLARIS